MSSINFLMTHAFDLLFRPFVAGPGWLSLVVFSVVVCVCGLVVYKYTSNQSAIKRIKDRIKGHTLAIKLFKDDLGVMFRSLGHILRCSLSLFRYALVPLLVMMVPFVLVTAQLGLRYQRRPLHVGESVVVSAKLAPEVDLLADIPTLETGPGIITETPPVRIPSEHQVLWRVRATEPGRHTFRVRLGEQAVEKTLTVGEHYERVSVLRSNGGFWEALIYPAEGPLPADSVVQAISVAYPDRDSWFCGTTVWVLWLMGLSFVLTFLFKPLLGVEF